MLQQQPIKAHAVVINISKPPSTPSQYRFSPTVDCFCFSNDIPKQAVSYFDALNAINSVTWANQIPTQLKPILALFSVGMNRIQLGNCFGMSYTAKYYFEHPDEFESNFPDATNMHHVSARDRHISREIVANQFPGQIIIQPYLFNAVMTHLGLNSLNDTAQWIMHEIDNYRVVQLYLTKLNTDLFFFHSVLVFDYQKTKDTLNLDIYDPNHAGQTRKIKLTKNQNGDYIINRTGLYGDVITEYGASNIGAGECTNINWDIIINHMSNLSKIAWQLACVPYQRSRGLIEKAKKLRDR